MEKKEIEEKIEIPKSFKSEIKNRRITITSGENKASRIFKGVKISAAENKIIISGVRQTKKDKRMVKTTAAHIKNMTRGLEKGFIYKLQICFVHFPITVSVDKAKNLVIIKNFLGEVKERTAKILPEVKAEVVKDIITVSGADKESAGQTAANIEAATKIKNRDRRTFQDGIFMIEKCGELI